MHSATIVVRTSPESLYDLLSDVTRTGEWSPVCRECTWDEGASGQVGDRFTGRNDNGTRQWETRSQVVAAERGREFAWMVGELGRSDVVVPPGFERHLGNDAVPDAPTESRARRRG